MKKKCFRFLCFFLAVNILCSSMPIQTLVRAVEQEATVAAETVPDESAAASIRLPLILKNCVLQYKDETLVEETVVEETQENTTVSELTVMPGAVLEFWVTPTSDSAEMPKVMLGQKEMAPAEDGLYSVQIPKVLEEGTSLEVSITETETPVPSTPALADEIEITLENVAGAGGTNDPENLWYKEKNYTYSISGSANIVSVDAAWDDSGEKISLAQEESGKYILSATRNGAFTITVECSDGSTVSYTENVSEIDITPPAIHDVTRTVKQNGVEAAYSFRITDTQSGVAEVLLVLGDGTNTILTSDGSSYSFSIQKNQTFEIHMTDHSGNTDVYYGEESGLDSEVPAISSLRRQEAGWAKEAHYTFLASDAASGIGSVSVKTGDGAEVSVTNSGNQYAFILSQNTSFEITVVDRMGNSASMSGKETQVDTLAPELKDLKRTKSGWASSVEYTFSATDTLSGIRKVTVYLDDREIMPTSKNGVYQFTVTANCNIRVVATDQVGNQSELTATETMIDTASPSISAFVRQESGWVQQAHYSFTASDEGSGVKSVSLDFSGKTTVLTPDENGVYHFVADQNGSFSVTVTDGIGKTYTRRGTENQVDLSIPVIRNLKRVEQSWSKQATYTFSASDGDSGIQSVSVSIDGGEANALAMTAGIYRFTMPDNGAFQITVTDKVGRVATASGSETQIDLVTPEIQTPIRNSENWTASATYQANVTDSGSGVKTVQVFNEKGAQIAITRANGQYLFTVTENGRYRIAATDAVGNTAEFWVEEAQIDTEPPTVSDISRDPEGWSKSGRYTFRVTDGISGVKGVTVLRGSSQVPVEQTPDGSYAFNATANASYTIQVEDLCGNIASISVRENQIDFTPPSISRIQPDTKWDAEKNTVTFSAADDHTLDKVSLRDENGNACNLVHSGSSYSATLFANGTYTITAYDAAGNSTSATFEISFIDTESPTQPVVTSDAEGWVNRNVVITASAEDQQSDVADYYYSTTNLDFNTNKGAWRRMSQSRGTAKVIFTADQDATYYIIAVDHVGRVSQASQIRVQIDKTSPETVSIRNLTDSESGFITTTGGSLVYLDRFASSVHASDAGSGAVEILYQLRSESYKSNWISLRLNDGSALIQANGIPAGFYTVYVKVRDQADNETAEFTAQETIVLERSPKSESEKASAPDVKMTVNGSVFTGDWTNADLEITVSGSDPVSGVHHYEYCIDYAEPSKSDLGWTHLPDGNVLRITTNTNAQYSFRAVSNAGLVSKVTTRSVLVQKTAPTAATISVDAPTGTNGWHTRKPVISARTQIYSPYQAPVSYETKVYRNNRLISTSVTSDLDSLPAVDSDGIWKIELTTIDKAGNRTAPSVIEVKYDHTPPTSPVVCKDREDITHINDALTGWKDGVNHINYIASSDYTIFENHSVRIEAGADGGISGLAQIYYQVVSSPDRFVQNGNWLPLAQSGIQLTPEGKFCLYFKAVDGAGNTTFFSGESMILDSLAPGGDSDSKDITVLPTSVNQSSYGIYSGDVTVKVSVHDPNPSANTFSGIAKVIYRVIADGNVTQSGTLFEGDPHGEGVVKANGGRVEHWTGTFTISSERNNSDNVVVQVAAFDRAGNATLTGNADNPIRIDLDKPVVTASYDNNKPVTTFDGQGAFTGSRTLTVKIDERNFQESLAKIQVMETDSGTVLPCIWSHEGNIHTALFSISSDGHYEVSASVADAADHSTSELDFDTGTVSGEKFIIDNTAPVVAVSYNNNNARNDLYFNAPRTVTVRIQERNFDPAKFGAKFTVSLDGGGTENIALTGWTHSGASHTLTYTCDRDGVYKFELGGTDAVGNSPSTIRMDGNATDLFVVDTTITAPVFSDVIYNGAYAGAVKPSVYVLDTNLDTMMITMSRTNRNGSQEDVTGSMLSDVEITEIDGGKSAVLDVFKNIQEYDGIYTITAFASDYAGNIVQSDMVFSVNRFGSIYLYDTSTANLLNTSRKVITNDLVISEYNPSSIVDGSSRVYITRDGVPISDPIFEVNPVTPSGEPGAWCQYDYCISKDNFLEEGTYEIVISTQDTAGNFPENTAEEYILRFSVDHTPPQIPSILGLEKAIHNGATAEVILTATDNVSVQSITVYVNDAMLTQWDNLSGYSVEQAFEIPEGMNQTVRIVVVDEAGNSLDTDDESFLPGYAFHRIITVSANTFLRFYANKPLFYGSISGAILLGLIWIIVLMREEQREQEEEDRANAAISAAQSAVEGSEAEPGSESEQ